MSSYFVERFVKIIEYYLLHLNKSEILSRLENSNYILLIGLNSIIHIFKIILYKTKNIEHTYFCCQKSIYCYLEYIEQMNNINVLHNLNVTDAISFIYKKTMDSEENVTNIISNNEENQILEDIDLIQRFSVVSKTILFSKSEFQTGKKENNDNIKKIIMISENHLKKYISLINTNPDLINIFFFIQEIQEKIKLDYDDYNSFLTELYKRIKGIKKTNDINNSNENNILSKENLDFRFLELFFIEENKHKYEQYLQNKKMNLFVKMLLT
jgi:hypothetical protein